MRHPIEVAGKPNRVYFGNSAEFAQAMKEHVAFANQIEANKRSERPVTLEDVGKAKIIFDMYMKVKANAHLQEQIKVKSNS
jgi:hypothetical protein